ncbi:MAG: tetratricopeptide repeat protein [Victivallaceae bacterium]
MDKKTLKDIISAHRDLYQKAVDAGNKRNWDYAIKMMLEVLKKYPTLTVAREKIREFEKGKAAKMGFFGKIIAQIKSSGKVPKIKALINKSPVEAMSLCETELAGYIYNPLILNLLADASAKAEALYVGIETLLLIRSFKPKNEANLRKLADFYKADNQGIEVLKIFQQIVAMHPNDLKVQSELRSATALASMQKGDWEKEGTTQEKSRDNKGEAVVQQMEEGSIHDSDQAGVLIAKYQKDLAENESIDTRRKLAEAYFIAQRYDESIEELNKVAQAVGAMDPAIDKNIERSYLAKIDGMIGQLKTDPTAYENPEEQIRELETHCQQYRLRHATERVEKYPNDTQLRYDLAKILFDAQKIDEAVEHFQYARRNPQRRLSCMVYLGQCFAFKEQYDMSIEQFVGAVAEMGRMDKVKMDAVYNLGRTYEAMGNYEKAVECYKDIYQANVNYSDIGQRIQQYYDRQKNKG